ncbi:MAG: PQQ-binding-like beta-propeller repeat protein, partial [Planctomycetota bacterium]
MSPTGDLPSPATKSHERRLEARGRRRDDMVSEASMMLVRLTLVALVTAQVATIGCGGSSQLQGQLIGAWRDADEAFRKTQFTQAAKDYRFITQRLQPLGSAAAIRADRELADTLATLCDTLAKADQSVSGDLFDEGQASLVGKYAEQLRKCAAAATEVPKEFELGGRTAGSQFTPAQRAAEVAGWARQRLEAWQNRWNPDLPDATRQLDDCGRLLQLVRQFGDSEAFAKTVVAEHTRLGEMLASRAQLTKLREACDDCLRTPSRATYDVARDLRDSIRAAGGDEATLAPVEQRWNEFRKALPAALRAGVRAQSGVRASVRATTRSIDRLPLDAACAMSAELLELPADPASPLIFALAGERCYALEARRGRPRWALRVGYSMQGLPIAVGSSAKGPGTETLPGSGDATVLAAGDDGGRVALAWGDSKARHVSVLRAADGEPLWTAALPEKHELAGPLVVAGGAIHAVLDHGQLWRFDLETGAIQGVLDFPEPIVGPLLIDSDGRRAIVLGRDMAMYALPLEAPLRVAAVHLLDDNSRYEDTFGLWAAPFAILVRNTAAGKAQVQVFREPVLGERGGNDGGQRLQSLDIPDRVWQPPLMLGNQLLLATESGEEIVLGVDVNQPQSPLYELHRQGASKAALANAVKESPDTASIAHPECALHPDGGFVVLRNGAIEAWTLDVLNRAGVRRERLWNAALDANECPTQPLQTVAGRLFSVTQHLGKAGARVREIDPRDGSVLWRAAVGLQAEEIVYQRVARDGSGRSLAVVLTSGDTWRLFDGSASGVVASRHLPWSMANPTLEWVPLSRKVAWIDAAPRPRLVIAPASPSALREERAFSLPHPAGSALAAFEGRIGGRGEADAASSKDVASAADATSSKDSQLATPPLWFAAIDSGRRIMLAQGDADSPPPQFQDLPAQLPANDWMRPQWLDGRGIVVAHPRGYLLSATVQASDALPFLARSAHTLISDQGLVGPPVILSQRVWTLDRDGTLRVFDWPSLALKAELEVGSPTTRLVASERSLHVGLRDGGVANIAVEAGLPGELRRVAI